MGRAIQQNAQMMNMLAQQRASQRQAAQTAQEMEIARAAEARAAAKEGRDIERFAVDQDALLYAKYRNMAPSVIESNDPEVYAQWLGMLNEENPQRAQIIARAMPPERFDKETFRRMMATMDQSFEARYGKAITKELITPKGDVLGANISGLPGATYATPIPDISRPRAGAGAQTPPSAAPQSAFPKTATPATDAQIDEAAQKIIRGAGVGELGISADDFDRASARANQLKAAGGARMQPISMTTGAQMGAQPDMAAVVQDMMSSGQISQSNLQLMREMAGPDKDAQLAQILKANNIQIVPDDQPGMRSAVFRPGQDVAPQMQQVQFNPNDYEPVRVKSPMQSPAPGTVLVPTPVIRKQAEAEEAGKLGPRITAEPQIEGGKKTAELRAQRDFEFPQSTGRFETNLARMDLMLTEIERLRKHPAYTRIIGPVDAFTPNFGRARGAQAIYNTLMALGTAEELQSMRRSNETGGAVGNVSDADLKLLERGFAALDQSQMEGDFEASVEVLIARIKAARDRLVKEYKDTYSYRLPKTWSPPSPKSKPTQGGRKVGGFTVLEVED